MALIQDFGAEAAIGFAGPLIMVNGLANTNKLDVQPELKIREGNKDESVLALDLVNAFDNPEQKFKEVSYTMNIVAIDLIKSIELYSNSERIYAMVIERITYKSQED